MLIPLTDQMYREEGCSFLASERKLLRILDVTMPDLWAVSKLISPKTLHITWMLNIGTWNFATAATRTTSVLLHAPDHKALR